MGQADYWADDSDLYQMTKDQTGLLSPQDFYQRYPGQATLGQYGMYQNSYNNRPLINAQNNLASGMTSAHPAWTDFFNNLNSVMPDVPGAPVLSTNWETRMPGYENTVDYNNWYLPYVQNLMQQQAPQYPGSLNLQAPEGEADVMSSLRDRAFGDREGLAGAYEGRFENVLPQFRSSWEENTLNPTKERLASLGMTDDKPGIDVLAGLGSTQAKAEASLRSDIDIGRAEAQRQDWADRLNDIGAYQQGLQTQEQRALGNMQRQYGDWQKSAYLPYDLASGVGQGLYGQGQSAYADLLAQDAAAQNAMASMAYQGIMSGYNNQWQLQMMALLQGLGK